MLYHEASKGEVSSLRVRAGKDREDMVKDYRGSLELIFAYSYGFCMFKNNICGDRLEISNGMLDSANSLPPEFFVNPRCPPSPTAVEVKDAEVDQGGAVEDSGGGGGGGGGAEVKDAEVDQGGAVEDSGGGGGGGGVGFVVARELGFLSYVSFGYVVKFCKWCSLAINTYILYL